MIRVPMAAMRALRRDSARFCGLALVLGVLLCGAGPGALGEQLSWEMPGRLSIYDLEFGPAMLKDNNWQFLGNARNFNAKEFEGRLTLMIRFTYRGTRGEIPLKFVVKLPDSTQHEETALLTEPNGTYTYRFTVHNPQEFAGAGSIYLYYGFSIIDVLDFTIFSGA
ncbi:MAG: hypothetical protein AB1473_09570 [Thermodesulfobacteriota bacterium]